MAALSLIDTFTDEVRVTVPLSARELTIIAHAEEPAEAAEGNAFMAFTYEPDNLPA